MLDRSSKPLFIGYPSFDEVIEAVEKGTVDATSPYPGAKDKVAYKVAVVKIDGALAFMFETAAVLRPTQFALASPQRQQT